MGPDVIIAGMMKAGTTSLYRWLDPHPSVVFCEQKEPHFFTHQWHRGVGWYEAMFADEPRDALRFEASQSYTHPDLAATAAQRIRATLPHVRLIFVLRDPLARARSEYRHQVMMGREKRPFSRALLDPRSPYLRRSCYGTTLRPYLDHFSRDRLLFLEFSKLVDEDPEEWQRLLDWLDLAPIERKAAKKGTTRQPRAIAKPWAQKVSALFGGQVARVVPASLKRLARSAIYTSVQSQEGLFASAEGTVPGRARQRFAEEAPIMEELIRGG